ncbi:alanine--tRNA ligase [Methylocaldum szegediense]|uniref:Alanine--tRNA ligase n=1 Tax=Methylocaldum szegediense TaxID=73780 RepID=A0ABM9I5U7_9GAMM|nr:alanine--tRNA ligase [Methylocaldum szegediense]CAI8910609.1 alanine--tRNA ligase/DNA-binding transcriptional repressor [Methylocaldum szegediense]
MTSAELRSLFLKFFEERQHTIVPSSSLIPADDPTLLFTNAGMVQFKDVFLGREKRPYVRAASAQRCVRAGGKHNDLENVGYTARHHTFFEMLGNFSFGDYFKREAIHYAWEFLTGVLKLPTERLWVTVFDQDKEAESIWLKEIGVDPARFARIGSKDNFWSMGDTGPCGPCTEIFYDHGEGIPGGPPGSPDADGDRYIEIWNLVFMQYDRASDGTLSPLPKPSVDTGMGLERIAAVVQGVHSNYDIDLFRALLKAAADIAQVENTDNSSLRVLADHIRSCAFLITDGVLPSNEGRGYVLRRIIRRAIRHGYKLGVRDTFFYRLVAPLCAQMGDAYPELVAARPMVEQVLKKEEERFAETLEQGMKVLETHLKGMSGKTIPGDTVFLLYDTYGFPVDLTADFAREHGLVLDMEGFERAMEEQRERARAASHFGVDYSHDVHLDIRCDFTGYTNSREETRVAAVLQDGKPVELLTAGEEGILILERTPFYAESGGQVGDRGTIRAGENLFEVLDTQKKVGDLILHIGRVSKGTFKRGLDCEATVDVAARNAIARNHSATHLLHSALRKVLGEHVIQKGSLVAPDRLRFDFSHFAPVTADQLEAIERLVNEQIRANNAVSAEMMPKDEAIKAGAMALFGEKYGDFVRVLRIGDFSTELCGGIHVQRAGDIGLFKIVSETGVAAGVRRIEALTGEAAVQWVEKNDRILQSLSERMKVGRDALDEKVNQLLERNRSLEKELERLKGKLASVTGDDLASRAISIDGVKVLAAKVDESDPKELRDMVDQLRNKLGSAAIVLGSVKENKVTLIAGVTKDQTARIKAGDLVNAVAVQVGGKGGGRADMAQAGGTNPAMLDAALKSVPDWVRRHTA